MGKTVDLFIELYETNNMVQHLKNKLNAESKVPVDIATAISCTRVLFALQKRVLKILQDHVDLTVYSLHSRDSLTALNTAFTALNNKFTEDDLENLSSEQKNVLVENLLKVEEGLLYITGRVVVELESKGLYQKLTKDQHEFAEKAKDYYIKREIKEEEFAEKHADKLMNDSSIEEIEEQEDLESGLTLDSISDNSKPRQIISPDIDI